MATAGDQRMATNIIMCSQLETRGGKIHQNMSTAEDQGRLLYHHVFTAGGHWSKLSSKCVYRWRPGEATYIIIGLQLKTRSGNLHHNVTTAGNQEKQLISLCVNS
ncbi:hypothetical protein DPMN_114926 [Dreissena polymorpha]|uniref:Uncharacterized protein n=1 Tax=Dreissena polymorpha TaxID=45954 RepID=A0A9D4KKB9_DREPO|nr:hypothetical protein DPMN_114926 [Dreissena polymorpha]